MPKLSISKEERQAEAAALRGYFDAAKTKEPDLTQESLAAELDVSQGLIHQWLSGRTPIPEKRLTLLSKRLGFNPGDVRKSLTSSLQPQATEKEKLIIHAYLNNPDFQKIVDTIAISAGYVRK